MALTDLEIKQWVENYVNTNPGYTWEEWNGHTFGRGLHHKYSVQLYSLQDMYAAKFKRLYQHYKELREGFQQGVSDAFIQTTSEDAINDLKAIKDKGWRIADKLRTLNAEIAGREAGQFGPGLNFDREYRGTEYYLDLTDGTDAAPHTGLKYGNYNADAGSGATTLIETSELGRTVDNDWNGAWIWNATRGAGAKITASTYVGGTWTLTHASISGQASGDTYYILDAWKTMAQYTSVTGRTPGDKAYVRANTTEAVLANVVFDESGTALLPLKAIGCDSVINDPWGDASDVKPIWSFGDAALRFYLSGDHYWQFERMILKETGDSSGNLHYINCYGAYLKDCEFTDNSNASDQGLILQASDKFVVDGCVFKDNLGDNIFVDRCCGVIKNCTFDGGVTTTNYGVTVQGGVVDIIDTDFGQTTTHELADIRAQSGAVVYCRNVKLGSTPKLSVSYAGLIYEEDANGVKGANLSSQYSGVVTKDAAIVRSGGADSSAKMEPSSVCGLYNSLLLVRSETNQPFRILTAASLTTITVYIRSLGTWGTYPTADELYVEASYLSASSGGARTKVQSSDVLSHPSDWKAFDVTFTPLQAGFVYLNVFLKVYEDAGDGCYVSIEPPGIS